MSENQTLKTALSGGSEPSKKKIISWAMWDWGTQPFATVITTFVFSVYITSEAFGDTNSTSLALSWSTGLAGVIIAFAAPVLGQTIDRSGRNLTVLRNLTWVLAIITACLFFVKPDPAYLWLGLGLLAVGNIVSEIAGVSYNALLEDVAGHRNVGRVSGFGWGLGYIGGILILVLLLVLFLGDGGGVLGTTENGLPIRASMLMCAAWMLVFTAPTFINLTNPPLAERRPIPGIERWSGRNPRFIWVWLAPVIASYAELFNTIRRLWNISRHTVYFLLASALFRDGLAGVFAFGAVIAAGTFGLDSGEVIVFGAAANITAGIATMVIGLFDDRFGPKKVILFSLGMLVAMGLVIFFGHNAGKTLFWVAGLIMTMFLGPAQSASRSFLARLIPEGRSGEVFGLYATTGRVVSFLSPTLFGMAIVVGQAVTGSDNTQYWGILGIALVLLAGFVVMLGVKEHDDHVVVE